MLQIVMKNSGSKLFKASCFTTYHAKYVGKDVRIIATVLHFSGGEVKPGYQIGTRRSGFDAARWPEYLGVEIAN